MTHYPNPVTQPLTVEGTEAQCLTEIFRRDVNLTLWRRQLSTEVETFAAAFCQQAGRLERFRSLTLNESAAEVLPSWALELPFVDRWLADVEQLIDMYRCLFEPDAVGLRLHVIESTMCPRFHVDRVPARLLCTYRGVGTEWLPESLVSRPQAPGPLPEQSVEQHQVQRIPTGAVALLKGEAWEGNEGRGLVHRSPAPEAGSRLVLGLDWL